MEALEATRRSDLPRLTETAIRAYYCGDYAPLLSLVTPDCVFIGAGSDVYLSLGEMADNPPAASDNPLCRVDDARFWLVGTGCETQALVMGLYDVYSDLSTGLVTAVRQRITVSCRLEGGVWKAYCIHSSNEWGDPAEEGIYPLNASRKTYEYVQRIVQTSLDKAMRRQRVAFNVDGELTFVDPERIMYVESNGKSSVIHLEDGSIPVKMMIGDMEEALPSCFVRIHRYYLVNAHCVRSFSQEGATLPGGTVLRIPKRRYASVRESIVKAAAE